MPCRSGNYPERVCALEDQYAQVVESVGHPAMTVVYTGSTFIWNPDTQTLTLPVPASTAAAIGVVRWADLAARTLEANKPTSLQQIGIQTTDLVNGNYSLWVATGLAAGNWTIKAAGMASQNPSAVAITGGVITGITDLTVADGGTGASTIGGARTNLTLPSLPTSGNQLDWSLSDNFYVPISAATTFTFLNTLNGKTVRLAAVMDGGTHGLTFPTVKWAGGTQTASSTTATTDLYEFRQINGVIYGTITKNFA